MKKLFHGPSNSTPSNDARSLFSFRSFLLFILSDSLEAFCFRFKKIVVTLLKCVAVARVVGKHRFSSFLVDFHVVAYNRGITISFVRNGDGVSIVSADDCSGLGAQHLCGKKRSHSSLVGKKLAGNVLGESGVSLSVPTPAQAPVCRPWHRGDLISRLSTFKSITWFAKPQVVSPLECARRGWVNVDADTIACVACNTRLLFTTPSAWTKQQVEKAAMVFSLKLDSGHNLLCPWINNSCTEELARFPNLSRASLIEDYKKRLFYLSQLMALPVVAPVAVDNLRTPHLEQFLDESTNSGCHESLQSSGIESSGHVSGKSSSILYYQAHKLICLLGWDPRILPYRVDFKDGINSFQEANVVITTGQKPKEDFQSSYDGTDPSSDLHVDPSSVVLDCKLCGASVGLWAFSTIPRPLEYIRFVGLTEVTSKNIAAHDEAAAQEGSNKQICAESRGGIRNAGSSASTSLGFTIAGGPPPALLNYGANISLPIVGRNLRARLPLKIGYKDHPDVQRSLLVEDQQVSQQIKNLSAEETVATMEPDVIASKPLGVPQYVAEDSTSNLNETAKGIKSVVTDELPQDTVSNINGGGTEPQREQNSRNLEEDERYNVPGTRASENHKPVLHSTGMNKQLFSSDKRMEFDPIKQHRHFCPWIGSTGKSLPGWQQTLSALEGDKKPINVYPSALIEVDDPIESVKNLFTSPDKKRAKFSGGS